MRPGPGDTVVDVVVIGAGPAGLAAAAMLHRMGIEALVVERGAGVAAAWRGRYDSLRLHTIRWLSGLPGMRIPRNYGRWVGRDDLVRYLEDYCETFDLSPRFGVDVRSLTRPDSEWRLETSSDGISAKTVVVATGANNILFIPDWPGRETFSRPVIHSSHYRNGSPYRERKVLVVGAGNSGAEIALDLVKAGAAGVSLAVRTPPNIVRRDTFGVPSQLLGIALRRVPERAMNPIMTGLRKLTIPDLSDRGLPAPSGNGYSQFRRTGTIPIIDSGFVAAVRAGRIEVRAGVESLDEDKVVHLDGTRTHPDTVIAATGYRPGLESMLGPYDLLDDAGLPRIPDADTDQKAPDLYTVGISIQLSGLLREIGLDARRVAARIAR